MDHDANLVLELDGALHAGEIPVALELELSRREGTWAGTCFGTSPAYNRGHHEGTVCIASEAGGLRLSVELVLGGDPWIPGGSAHLDIVLDQDPVRGGTYTGTVQTGPRHGPVAGAVRGRWDEVFPRPVPGHVPLQPEEHPRLICRAVDRDRLRALARETPEGRAITARLIAMIACEEVGKAPPMSFAHSNDGDKFSTWPAVALGFQAWLFDDAVAARRAADLVERTIFANPHGRLGKDISQDIHHGPRLMGLALAYDLCFAFWPEDLRRRCAQEIAQRMRELAAGSFDGQLMRGFNPNVWSNHNGIRMGCAGLGALAIVGDRCADGSPVAKDAARLVEISLREARGQLRLGFGQNGHYLEGGWYKMMTLQRGFSHFLHAIRVAAGITLDHEPAAASMLLGYLLEAPPGALFPDFSHEGPAAWDCLWTQAVAAVPPRHLGAVRWIQDRRVGLLGDATFGIHHGVVAPYALVTYPYRTKTVEPEGHLPWYLGDRQKGHVIVRPRYRDGKDPLLILNLKSQDLPACHYERSGPTAGLTLWGGGRRWLEGTFLPQVTGRTGFSRHGGRILAETVTATAVELVIDLSMAYWEELPKDTAPPAGLRVVHPEFWRVAHLDRGFRLTRRLFIDTSAGDGCDLLCIIHDRLELPTSHPRATWRLPLAEDLPRKADHGQRLSAGTSEYRCVIALTGTGLVDPRGSAPITGQEVVTVIALGPAVDGLALTGDPEDARLNFRARNWTVRPDGIRAMT